MKEEGVGDCEKIRRDASMLYCICVDFGLLSRTSRLRLAGQSTNSLSHAELQPVCQPASRHNHIFTGQGGSAELAEM